MRKYLQKHTPAIAFGVIASAIVILAAQTSTPPTETPASATLILSASDDRVFIGATTTVRVAVETSVPGNAVGAEIPIPDAMEVLSIDYDRKFFDLWTEEPSFDRINKRIRFGGGTLGEDGFVGEYELFSFTIAARAPSTTLLVFENVQILAHDGEGTNIFSGQTPLELRLMAEAEEAKEGPIRTSGGGSAVQEKTTTIAEALRMPVKMFSDYDPRYDLNGDGAVTITDMSILLFAIFKR